MQFQLRSFHNQLISPPNVNLSNSAAAASRNCFPIRYLGVFDNATKLKSVTSVHGVSIPFPANGVGRSSSFSSAAAPEKNKRKKTVKSVAVREKPAASSSEPAPEEIENVDLGKTGLSEESNSKITAAKKKKKKPVQSKKKDATDLSQVVAEEVSRKSSSKGKKTNLKVSNWL